MQSNSFTNFHLEDLYNSNEGLYDINLSAACMAAISLEELLSFFPQEREKILNSFLNTNLDYSEQYGDEYLRQVISEELYPQLNPNDLLVTSGSSEAIFLAFSTLFEAGDSIVVQKPIYQSLHQVAADRGVEIIDWQHPFDLNDLENKLKNTKALVINNPNNPFGSAFNAEELKEISSLLGDKLLICDEVFKEACLEAIPSALEIHENSLVISGLSKSYQAPGLRIGWMATPSSSPAFASLRRGPTYLELCSSYKNYLSIRSSTLSEKIAPWFIKAKDKLREINQKTISKSLDALYGSDNHPFELPEKKPISLIMFPKLKQEIINEHGSTKNYCQSLLEKRIFLVDGSVFGDKYSEHVRLGLGSTDFSLLELTAPLCHSSPA